MSFAQRLLRQRQGLGNIVGFNGGTLEDQLDDPLNQSPDRMSGIASTQAPQPSMADRYMAQAQPDTGQVLTPTNQQNITRPRTTQSSFGDLMRDRRTQPRDTVADDSQYLQDVIDKPDTWKDKLGQVSQVIARNLGSEPLPTRKQHAEQQATATLGRDLAVQRQQIMNQQGMMVPIYDTEGNVIGRAPARTAAGTQIRATDTASRLGETKRRNDAYIGHLQDIPKEKQADAARKMWSAGLADGNPELKADLAQRMGLKEDLPDSDKGSVEVDANGNYIVVHRRTGTATPVTQTQPDTTTPQTATPVTSFKQTQLTDQNTRSANAIAAANQRTATTQAGANQRAGMRQGGGGVDRATNRRAAELVGKIESAKQAMAAADERLKRDPNNRQAQADRKAAQGAGVGWATELNALNAGYEAGPGEQGYPYYKKSDQQAAPQSVPQSAGRPTKSLSAIRAAAQSKNLDPDEAERRARARTDITLIP